MDLSQSVADFAATFLEESSSLDSLQVHSTGFQLRPTIYSSPNSPTSFQTVLLPMGACTRKGLPPFSPEKYFKTQFNVISSVFPMKLSAPWKQRRLPSSKTPSSMMPGMR